MNILFLSQIVPFPPDAGPKVKTWHVLRYLHQHGHTVTLVAFMRDEEAPHIDALRPLCRAIHTVPLRRSRLHDIGYLARSQLSGRPFLVERDDLRPMRRLVTRLLREEAFDVVHADQLTMCEFVRRLPDGLPRRPRRVFDAHNATWLITQRMGRGAHAALRPILALETRRIRRYEADIVTAFDATLTVTDIDRDALLDAVRDVRGSAAAAAAAERLHTVPITIDTAKYQPVIAEKDGPHIVTLGSLHYPPNADGVRWFMDDVFPRVQAAVADARLTIVGKHPPDDFRARAAADPAVTVTGYVPDLRPLMARAAVLVVPVRAGGGMRVRILEAFAHQLPVVTTTVGLEGIAAEDGRHVLLGDTPEAFAAAVARLLRDRPFAAELAANGRRLVETTYDWQVALRRMDAAYG